MKEDSKQIVKATLAGIIAIGASLAAGSAYAVPEQPKNWEKCSGISKAGMNDCGSLDGKHACASQAKSGNDAQEWVYVPEGTCTKITGGKVAALKPAK